MTRAVDTVYVVFEGRTEDPISYHKTQAGAERKINQLYAARTAEILAAEDSAQNGIAVPFQLDLWFEELPLEE